MIIRFATINRSILLVDLLKPDDITFRQHNLLGYLIIYADILSIQSHHVNDVKLFLSS